MSSTATISRDELRSKIERGDPFFLFEVLGEPYYRRNHLPGARLMPPGDVEGAIRSASPPQDAEIVLYCWDEH